MKKIILLAPFLLIIVNIKAQDSSNIKPNEVYAEALGIGMRYSVNYERYFGFKNNDFGISISGGIAPNFAEPKYLWFPFRLEANYEIGNSKIGAGINYMFGPYWWHGFIHPEDVYISSDAFFLPHISYSYYCNSGIFLKLSLILINNNKNYQYNYLASLPFLELNLEDKAFLLWPGLSIGYSF